MNRKAVALFSGGLDSALAVKLILNQGIEVVILNFSSPISNNNSNLTTWTGSQFGRECQVISLGMDYLRMVEAPRHGYGKNMNPCIDCRIFMLRLARKYMEEIDASFVITGEVLGQRPMSQRQDTLRTVERESNLKELLLRPLSAQLLEPTIPEKEGIVDRDQLLGLSGRSRKDQMRLAEKLGIKDYSTPAGGCLLTDENFSRKLRDLFNFNKTGYTLKDVKLLPIGRHFRLSRSVKVIVGRNEGENKRIETMMEPHHYLLHPQSFTGPTALVCGELSSEIMNLVGRIIVRYGKPVAPPYNINMRSRAGQQHFSVNLPLDDESLEELRI
ncbi:MAG: hypothetical protein JSU92_10565 [Deltaproteobacteria bacterium]|nr:MAG: hypothetical protein JSU92_10565 [Deltaproteobacteria bacterium]